MSDRETHLVILRSAERWAKKCGPHWCSQLQPAIDDAALASLMKDIDDQGWFPDRIDAWGESPVLTLAQLGRVLSRELPAAFLPIVAHCLGLHWFGDSARDCSSSQSRPIAGRPYFDSLHGVTTVLARPEGDGWLLDGKVTWVVNAVPGCRCAVVARLPSGGTALFNVTLQQPACLVSPPVRLVGLWGVPIRSVAFSSFPVSAEALVSTDQCADERVGKGYRMVRWAGLGMLLGIIERLNFEAQEYAAVRTQGGKRIVEHLPVRHLLDTVTAAADSLSQWLRRLEDSPELDYTGAEIRRLALQASDCGLQVFGGSGYVCPGLPERCWRDVRQTVALCG